MSEKEKIDFKDYFVVDPESPTGLRWRDDVPRRTKGTKGGNCWGGTPAGNFKYRKDNTPKYITVVLHQKQVIVSRAIWSILYGEIPRGKIIDHLDGNPFNNKPDNLALKTSGQNNRNARKRIDNTSGFVGIRFYVKGSCTYCAGAYQDENGRRQTKQFNVQKVGLIPAFQKAVEFRLNGIKKMNNEFNFKYTNRHVGIAI